MLFRKLLKSKAIQKPVLEDGPVSFSVCADDPFIYKVFDLASGEVFKFHFFIFILPVPRHMLHWR